MIYAIIDTWDEGSLVATRMDIGGAELVVEKLNAWNGEDYRFRMIIIPQVGYVSSDWVDVFREEKLL